jgi:AraC-like DNA-binding protein
MYENTVREFTFIQKEYHDCHSFMSVQMLRSCHSNVEKWWFTNLSAPFWRWYHNTGPGATILMNKKRIALTPGSIFLIPPNTAFASTNTRPIRQLYLHFTLGMKHQPLANQIFSHARSDEETRLMRELILALADGKHRETEVSFLSQALVNLALAKIPATYWDSRPPDTRIESAIRKINEALPQAIGNRELARAAGMNVNAFTRLFRNSTGHSPHQYLLLRRLENAGQLLQQDDQSIEAIAEQTGFCDRFHLSRCFKQYFHNNPAAFRRRARS